MSDCTCIAAMGRRLGLGSTNNCNPVELRLGLLGFGLGCLGLGFIPSASPPSHNCKSLALPFKLKPRNTEIVGESRPLLYRHFSPNMQIFVQKCVSNHETKQSSKF